MSAASGRALGVVHLIGVRERERLDVEDDGLAARLRDERRAVVDAVALGGDEQHVERALRAIGLLTT
jgi:hypothetical protein